MTGVTTIISTKPSLSIVASVEYRLMTDLRLYGAIFFPSASVAFGFAS
jgi:hypothetical protein